MRLQGLELRYLLIRDGVRASLRRFSPLKEKASPHRLPVIKKHNQEQRGISIACIVKDEAPYFAEWLEFHLMIGVSHVFVYDNGSTDETPEVLKPYIRDGVVTMIPWRNFSTLHPQVLAYSHATMNFGQNFRWMAFIDVDEFIVPASGSSLTAALQEFGDQPLISLPWMNFGPSGHWTKPAGLVIESYTERAAFPPSADQFSLLRHKNIINPRKVESVSTHNCSLIDGGATLINERGERFRPHQARDLRFVSADKVRLHHYFTRSHEEIRIRIAKGRVSKRGNVHENVMDRRLSHYERAIEKDETMLRFVPELKARLAHRQGSVKTAAE